jgi:hypothetical protein
MVDNFEDILKYPVEGKQKTVFIITLLLKKMIYTLLSNCLSRVLALYGGTFSNPKHY